MLLAGPAGTGKSRLAAEKLHAYMLKYPGSTGLALRKTRSSMTNSTVLFLARSVIGKDPRVRHLSSANRFEYDNGSVLAYGGMADEEQREQIRSVGVEGGVDIIWMEEASRFSEDDYNEATARLRGHRASWQQIMLTTNPGPPGHWINQRLIMGGEAAVYDKARPEDNPYNPPAYIDALKRLTGILRQRLWEGLWVQAEGLVYPEFDLGNMVPDDTAPDPNLPFEIGFDEGYIDPRAILFIQRTPDRILVFDELYHSRHLAEVCVREILERCVYWAQVAGNPKATPTTPEEVAEYERAKGSNAELAQWCRRKNIRLPDIAIGSPEAKEMQQRLRLADIPYRSRPHEIVEGIKVVRELILDSNEKRVLQVSRKCKNLIKELTEGYKYPEGTSKNNEKPADGNDHANDALRYWAYSRAR